jgi:hypothetical protein
MADPADRAAFQTLATVKEEPSDLESESGDIKVSFFTIFSDNLNMYDGCIRRF